jgi:hypothetical protein
VKNQTASEIEVYPIEISKQASKSERGTPYLATKGRDKMIMERFNRLCELFGTHFKVSHGPGILKTADKY